jgi:hypothetical protein
MLITIANIYFLCRIRTRADGSDPDVSVVGGPFLGLNHWEGGVMGADGAMFCMPLNHDQVLRIRHIPSKVAMQYFNCSFISDFFQLETV